MSEIATETVLPDHGAVSPAPQNVGDGYKKAKHEMTGDEEAPPAGLIAGARFFLERFGHMMSRIVLTVLYFVLVTPVGIFYRFLADPFQEKYTGTSFRPWKSTNTSVEQARRQG